MKNTWKKGRIKNIGSLEHGKDQRDVIEENGAYPVLGSGGEFGRANKKLYDGPSVLIGRKGTINNPIFIEEPFWTIDTLFYTKIHDNIIPKFVYYLFCSVNWNLYDKSSAVPSLASEDIRNHPIMIPPISDQRRIVEVLDKKGRTVENLRNKLTDKSNFLKEYRSVLITQAVTKGLDPNVPMKDSRIEWLGEVPTNWGINKVGRMYEIEMGKMRQSEKKSSEDIKVNYLKSINIQWHRLNFSSSQSMWVHPSELRKVQVENGDLIICEGGEVGRGCIVKDNLEKPYIIEKSLHRVREKTEGNSAYLLYLLEAIADSKFFEVICNGATIKHLTADKLSELRVPMPTYDEQSEIVRFLEKRLDKIEFLIEGIKKQIQKLDEYRSALITAAVTGQIDVSEYGTEKFLYDKTEDEELSFAAEAANQSYR